MPKTNRSGREVPMVPKANFTSYYGHPIVKTAPWGKDIPAYLFLGGLAGASSLLALGAEATGNGILRRNCKLTAVGAIGASYLALIHDLGKPSRFVNMLRVAKPTSPMSIGTWIITFYGPAAGLSAASELRHLVNSKRISSLLKLLNKPATLGAATLAPALSSYTAVLLGNTATPAWHSGFKEMPFVFVGSSALAAGGMGMLTSPVSQSAIARRFAIGGAITELFAMKKMEESMGLVSETLNSGPAGQLLKASKILSISGLIGTLLIAPKSRLGSIASGAALVLSSICTRFGIFEAGQASSKDPKYTVIPQKLPNS